MSLEQQSSICSAQKLNDRRCRNKSKSNSICHYHRYHPYKFKLNLKLKHKQEKVVEVEQVESSDFTFTNSNSNSNSHTLHLFHWSSLLSLFLLITSFNLFTIAYINSNYDFDKTISALYSIQLNPQLKETFYVSYNSISHNFFYLQGLLLEYFSDKV